MMMSRFALFFCLLFSTPSWAFPWPAICADIEKGASDWKKPYIESEKLKENLCNNGCTKFSCGRLCVQEACKQLCDNATIQSCLSLDAKGELPEKPKEEKPPEEKKPTEEKTGEEEPATSAEVPKNE